MLRVLFSPEKVETITLAYCVLHNLLHTRVTAQQVYIPPGSVDTEDRNTHTISQGEWQSEPQPSSFETYSASISILSMEVYRGSGIWCSCILNSIFCLSYCHVCQALLYVLYLAVVGNSLLGCHPEIRVVGNGSI